MSRPNPVDPSIDYVDESGTKIEVKGALVRSDGGLVTSSMVDGLIDAALEETNRHTAADIVVVDVEDLTDAEIERVREALDTQVTTERMVVILR